MSEARVKLAKIVMLSLENVAEKQIADSEKNLNWFSANHLSLSSKYSGKYILIKNKKVLFAVKTAGEVVSRMQTAKIKDQDNVLFDHL